MKTAVKWGVILGVSVCLWTLAIHYMGFYTTRIGAGQKADVIATILPIASIVLALRERRGRLGRGLRVSESLATGLVVGLVSVPITACFLWWYHHYMNPQWVDYLVQYQRETMTAKGATADAIVKAEETQRASARDSAQLLGALIGTTVISLVIALITGLFFRKPAKKPLNRL